MEGIGGLGYGGFLLCGLWGWIGSDWIGLDRMDACLDRVFLCIG